VLLIACSQAGWIALLWQAVPTGASPLHPLLAGRRGVYLLTRPCASPMLLHDTVAAALDAGVVLVQYRDKSDDDARRHAEAELLARACAARAVPLVINDDIVLAAAVGAAGVHVGELDASVGAARATLGPEAIIGVSCYDDAGRAAAAATAGADYLAFGSFFPSPTKPHARRATPDLLAAAARHGRPRVAIGGITADNAGPLVAAGADLLAVISAVFDAPDPARAVRTFDHLFKP
jgi:thiamine-phosphate pyrophosphorylase